MCLFVSSCTAFDEMLYKHWHDNTGVDKLWDTIFFMPHPMTNQSVQLCRMIGSACGTTSLIVWQTMLPSELQVETASIAPAGDGQCLHDVLDRIATVNIEGVLM